MVTKIIPIDRYSETLERLKQEGNREPLQAYYVVAIQVNGDLYRLSILPYPRRKLAVLQAVKVSANKPFLLLTDAVLLLALLELWLSSTQV